MELPRPESSSSYGKQYRNVSHTPTCYLSENVCKKRFVMKTSDEGFLPLAHPCGWGQVDFGEFMYYDATQKEQTSYALTVSLLHQKSYRKAIMVDRRNPCITGAKSRPLSKQAACGIIQNTTSYFSPASYTLEFSDPKEFLIP